MPGKCCCGCCSLSTATSLVLVLSALEATLGLFCSTEILILLSKSEIFNPFSYIIHVDYIEDFDVVHGLVLAAIGLYVLWILSAIFAARGNITLSHGRLTPWVMLTYLITLFNLGTTIYFAVKFQNAMSETTEFFEETKPTKSLTYLALLTLFSGGGITMFLNIYFAHVVQTRGKEIDHDYSTLALYILSHFNHCSSGSRDGQRPLLLPEAPPSYAPNGLMYLPTGIGDRPRGSSGSSWSLSYEALRTMSVDQSALLEQKNIQRVYPSADLASMARREVSPIYHFATVDTSASSALPY